MKSGNYYGLSILLLAILFYFAFSATKFLWYLMLIVAIFLIILLAHGIFVFYVVPKRYNADQAVEADVLPKPEVTTIPVTLAQPQPQQPILPPQQYQYAPEQHKGPPPLPPQSVVPPPPPQQNVVPPPPPPQNVVPYPNYYDPSKY